MFFMQNKGNNQSAEEQLAKQIYDIIEHFKQDDPIGLPISLPDPRVETKDLIWYQFLIDKVLGSAGYSTKNKWH